MTLRVRQRVLEALPAEPPGLTVNTLACRLDCGHHLVREAIGALVSDGSAIPDPSTNRYHQATEDQKLKHRKEKQRPLRELIADELPDHTHSNEGDEKGPTILELAAALSVRPNAVSYELSDMADAGEVVRAGLGKRGDPYRHYLSPAKPGDAHEPPTVPDLETEQAQGDRGDVGETPGDGDPVDQIPDLDDRLHEPQPPEPRSYRARNEDDVVGDERLEPLPTDSGGALAAVPEAPYLSRDYLRWAYRRVAQDLRMRARELDHERDILDAGAKLLGRIVAELEEDGEE